MSDYVVAGAGSRSLRTADRAVQVDAMELVASRWRTAPANIDPCQTMK